MRIAFLTHEPFYPPSGGGSAEAVYLVTEMVRRGHDVHLFGPQTEEPARLGRQFGLTVHPFRYWKMGRVTPLKLLKYLLYPSALYRQAHRVAQEMAAQDIPFDLIFSQHSISAVAAGRLGRALRAPVIMNFLDFLTAFMETWPPYLAPPALIRQLERYEIGLPKRFEASGVLTVSDPLAARLAANGYPRSRILPIYYGYDATHFNDRQQEASEKSSSATIVMHGSLDYHHLGKIARDTITYVLQRRTDVRFRLIGPLTPAVRTLMRELEKSVSPERIECTGFIPYDTIASHLREADVGMVPYESSEGTHCAFVAKIVEYAALGIPVVSTPLDGIQRYFRDEPLIRFGEFSGDSLGQLILDWLNTPHSRRAALGKSASDRISQSLEWRIIARKAVDFVEAQAAMC